MLTVGFIYGVKEEDDKCGEGTVVIVNDDNYVNNNNNGLLPSFLLVVVVSEVVTLPYRQLIVPLVLLTP